jgi:hypothetical protein
MSLPLEDLSKNYWKYHYDSVLWGFHLLIDTASDSVQVNEIFFLSIISHFLFITIIITKCSFFFCPMDHLECLGIESFGQLVLNLHNLATLHPMSLLWLSFFVTSCTWVYLGTKIMVWPTIVISIEALMEVTLCIFYEACEIIYALIFYSYSWELSIVAYVSSPLYALLQGQCFTLLVSCVSLVTM